ncbi:MAG: hypothetical protein JW993_07175 [Sedimentisphaerales bacterium]|nr:hypothetical protein [Sedimentisphaerales bacterium]
MAKESAPTGLMCELMARPELTTIADPRPEFGWVAGLTVEGSSQTAYQILVASGREQLAQGQADMWDSGKVASAESINVEYAGEPLAANATYYWKVRVWDRNDQTGPYSQVQAFSTGALSEPYATTRYPLVTTAVEPVRVVEKGPGHYFVDFGKAAFGTVELTLTSPVSRTPIEVHLGEVATESDSVNRAPGGSRRYRKMTETVDAGTHTYRIAITPDSRNTGSQAIKMPAYVGEVMPFRYCELVNVPAPIDTSSIRQIAVHYPFDDNASSFISSDAVLNDVWELCKYSIKATSFCGVYVDGDRERIPYEADAYINQLCHYAVDREFTMARYTHEYLITHPTWPTEWILHSVLMAWADYMHTANTESIRHFYADLGAKTLIALAREDGLISTQTGLVTRDVLRSIHFNGQLRDIVDWPHGNILGLQGGYGETDDFVFKPINTVVNAFHYRALVVMSRMAQAIGEDADAQYFADAAAWVRHSFNDKLLDKTKGIYVDGEGTDHSALHANMFPLAFGLVPPEYVDSVAQFVKSRGMVCSVYGAQYLLEALYEAGEDDYALDLMTDTESDRSWPHMIYDVGTTITMEAWDAKYKPNLDWNHAWGAAPANIIPRYVMGIQPLEPGFAKVRIKPQPGALASAGMDLPTIRGTIHVDFTSAQDQPFVLNVRTPVGVEAVVYLPQLGSDSPDVRVDGQIVQGALTDGFVVLDGVGPGAHRFERAVPSAGEH